MKTNEVYGECAKHPGQNMINCSDCELEQSIEENKKTKAPDWMQEMFDRFFRDDVPRLNEMYLMNWIRMTLWMDKHQEKAKNGFKIEITYPTGEPHKDSIKISCPGKKPLILKNYL